MDKKIRILGIIAAIAASIIIINLPSNPIVIPEPTTNATKTKFVEVVATNLQKPWAMDFADTRIFFTEKVGRIRVIESDTLLEEPLANLRVADVIEGGLLGLVLHPDFVNNHHLYVFYTYSEDNRLWNKVIRITESENKLVHALVILDKIPGAEFDNGGVIKFGPDNKLYVGTGDATDQHSAQDLQSLSGKILRLNDDGTIPSDNPFQDLPVFSYGHRNPQGMTWDKSGNLYVTEHGPTKNDELIMASLRGTNLYQLTIENQTIISQKSILGGVGRIRDVNEGSDGYLYILTGNTDGKGFPDKTDDKLIRIVK